MINFLFKQNSKRLHIYIQNHLKIILQNNEKNTWKFTKKPGKIMEISWNFVSPKKWEPCIRIRSWCRWEDGKKLPLDWWSWHFWWKLRWETLPGSCLGPLSAQCQHSLMAMRSWKIIKSREMAWQKYDFIGLTFWAYKMNGKINYFGQASPLKLRYLLIFGVCAFIS